MEIAVKGGAITILRSSLIFFIRGKNFSKKDLASAQVMCIFQLPAITDFLKILSPRKYFSESDQQINKRAVFAQSSGLTPIVCVGETLEQRERGEADRVITRQVEQGLENTDPSNLIVAYEPIWAIGTGKTCEAKDANKICSLIRKLIGFDDVIIQYGGSVKPNNIDEIMSMSDIDGVLVGGASLDPNSFARIANYQ